MGRKRKKGNKTPQKINNNPIEDLLKNEGNEYPVADPSKMMISSMSFVCYSLPPLMSINLQRPLFPTS
jgi:hypothetical protein